MCNSVQIVTGVEVITKLTSDLDLRSQATFYELSGKLFSHDRHTSHYLFCYTGNRSGQQCTGNSAYSLMSHDVTEL